MQPNRGYYVLVARQIDTYPPVFRWKLCDAANRWACKSGTMAFPAISRPGWLAAERWQISLSNLSQRTSGAIDPSLARWTRAAAGPRPFGQQCTAEASAAPLTTSDCASSILRKRDDLGGLPMSAARMPMVRARRVLIFETRLQ